MRYPSSKEVLTASAVVAGLTLGAGGLLAARGVLDRRREARQRALPAEAPATWRQLKGSSIVFDQAHEVAVLLRSDYLQDQDRYLIAYADTTVPAAPAPAPHIFRIGNPVILRRSLEQPNAPFEVARNHDLQAALIEASASPDWDGEARIAIPLGNTAMAVCIAEEGQDGKIWSRPTMRAGVAQLESLRATAMYPGLVIARPQDQ
jgi:hypothetical protein